MPRRKQPEAPETDPASSEEKPEGGNAKVLVVDDYQDNCEMYAEYLNFAGFEVATADNGEAAVSKAQTSLPDVILMDLSLPLMDGWQAIRLLKQDERTQKIPVIALTGHAMPAHEKRAREAGCDAFLPKPCLPQDVEERIRALLKGGKGKIER